jgi:hypothetical protein
MRFLYPSFLWALLAIAIPILIHLFHFRRYHTVYFSNVRFLKEIKEETRTRNKLRQWLILLSRVLFVCFLVFAFAQPFIPQAEDQKPQAIAHLSVFVDNSFSMNAQGSSQSLLEEAKERARALVEGHASSDRFQLLTQDLEGRYQRFLDPQAFLLALDQIELSPISRPLSQIVQRSEELKNSEGLDDLPIYLISDFQKNQVDINASNYSSLRLLPLEAVDQRNLSLDSVWLSSPLLLDGQVAELNYRVRNYGDEDAESVSLQLLLGEQVKALADLEVLAGSSTTGKLEFTPQSEYGNVEGSLGELRITDYPITYDDRWFLSLNIRSSLPVLAISENSNSYLRGLGKAVNLDIQSPTGLDYTSLINYRLIILDEPRNISSGLAAELENYIENGGELLLFPSPQAALSNYNDFLGGSLSVQIQSAVSGGSFPVNDMDRDHPLFAGVFENVPNNLSLPSSTLYYPIRNGSLQASQTLMSFRGGLPFLERYAMGEGHLTLCASPLDLTYNDFAQQAALFVPLVFNLAAGSQQSRRRDYTIGAQQWISSNLQQDRTEAPELLVRYMHDSDDEALEFIPLVRAQGQIQVDAMAKRAGHYELLDKNSEASLDYFALNYNRKESELDFLSQRDLQDQFASAGAEILDASPELLVASVDRFRDGRQLWKLCVILALLFLAIEIALIRLA